MKARTRIAPSPTGYMHIGTLRMALYNYFLAKQTEGSFIIRIEDTDRARMVEGAVENLLETMKEIGIEHNEGPYIDENGEMKEKGDFGPYVQSKRLDLYTQHIDKLLEDGNAYRCFCSKERLTEMREEQRALKQTPKYDRACLKLTDDEIQAKLDAGESYVIRMKVPEGETTFNDVIRGTIKINNSEIDDQVIMKSDGFPTYHLAVVVDDHLMEITHIIRGEEWIPSTPKHLMLYKMFGWDSPSFAHAPLLLNKDKTKLSKRQGDVAVEDYLKNGYLPKALVNFIATLGYNPKSDQEIYDEEELIKLFDLSKVNKAGAVLNVEKLDWLNNHYLRQMTKEELAKAVKPFTSHDVNSERIQKALIIERTRLNRLTEFDEYLGKYIELGEYPKEILVWKKADAMDAKDSLEGILNLMSQMTVDNFNTLEDIEKIIKEYIVEHDLKNGNVLWPLRVALSGKERSPSPFELLWVLGKEESAKRIDHAIKSLV